ncbi:MAG: hypothetical protein J7502_08450 [Flavisolibacter sp.]|nr:hypothetical protein [Flavisolibacter sp.]
MAYNIDESDGIGKVYAQKLQAHQINTTTGLLKRGFIQKPDSKLWKLQAF